MGSQYRSSLESMIHYVLAAPGAGKSAVAPHLRAFLPGSVILDLGRVHGSRPSPGRRCHPAGTTDLG
jgi:hypothetical protein